MKVNISNKDKTTHFVEWDQHSKLFKDKWTQKWEDTLNRDCTVVCNI